MTGPAMLLASNNAHKHAEILRVLGAGSGRIVCPKDLAATTGSAPPDPVEDGTDYLQNAVIKARAFSHWAGVPALADDSGLEVDALDGRPGLHSARYAGPDATFEDNCRRMLEELDGVAPEKRTARFICVLSLCRGDEVLYTTTGICAGRITLASSGSRGFGYDPIFQPDGHGVTFADLEAGQKDALSHRGRALDQLRKALQDGSFPLDLGIPRQTDSA